MLGDTVKQMSMSESPQTKNIFATSTNKQYPRLRFQKILINWMLLLAQKKIASVLTTQTTFHVL